jgi:GT2 family glycosyltransferase
LSTVTIIIPSYNKPDLLKDCLTALRANTDVPYELVIADDCSPDQDMQDYLCELDGYNVLLGEKNLGFPGNVNRAVEQTDGEYVCLLNQDTRVCRGWLSALMEEMQDDVAVVGCKLLYPRDAPNGGTIQHAGVARDSRGPFHIWRYQPQNYPPANVRREVNCVTFACVLLRRSVWEEVGGLDEGYVGGQFEDVDYCLKVREMGWKVVYTPKCVVWHREHGAGEEFANATSGPNRERLFSLWPQARESDTYLFDSIDGSLEGLARFVHQIRAAAIHHCNVYRRQWQHPMNIAQLSYDELPDVEKEWAREQARRLKELVK